MKKSKRVMLVVMAIVAVMAYTFTAFAKQTIEPRWSYFISIMGDMDVTSSGKATVIADVVANPTKVDQIKVECRLQRLEGSTWKTIKSWTESSDDNDPGSVSMEKTYYIHEGYSYRVQLNTKAYVDGVVKENLTNNFDYGYFS